MGVVVIGALYFAKILFIPMALAMLFVFVLAPAVQLAEHARVGRVASTLLVVLLATAAFSGVGWTVTRQFADVVNELPDYREH